MPPQRPSIGSIYQVNCLDETTTYMKITHIDDVLLYVYEVRECTKDGTLLPDGRIREVRRSELGGLWPYWALQFSPPAPWEIDTLGSPLEAFDRGQY